MKSSISPRGDFVMGLSVIGLVLPGNPPGIPAVAVASAGPVADVSGPVPPGRPGA